MRMKVDFTKGNIFNAILDEAEKQRALRKQENHKVAIVVKEKTKWGSKPTFAELMKAKNIDWSVL